MKTKQQNETLRYFKEYAQDWRRKASINMKDEVNIIKQRNDYVIKVVNERENTRLALDVGCGTGNLVCELAKKGTSAIGIDFAREMINIAQEKARKLKCKKAEFECCSIFDFRFELNTYDVISANGFIEYISYQKIEQLLNLSWKALRLGGSLILGSRNRLFNIFSLNEFTKQEIEENSVVALLREAIQIVKSADINDLIGFKSAPLQKEGKLHEKTGVQVSTRYQFTPAQLVNMLKHKGFQPIEIFPIHIHGVPPAFKDKNPTVHGSISNLLQNYANNNTHLIPQSSSFMLHCKKQ